MAGNIINKLKIFILYFTVVIITYWIWVYFSYLILPFNPAPYNTVLKEWHFDGYFKFQPGIYENDKFNTKFTINSKGFRNPEFDKNKGKVFRIIVLGESSTMGIESNDWDTWPSKLEQYLKRDGFIVEVINCGIGSSTSSNHLAMFKNEIMGYKPDLIIYYAGCNDYSTNNIERYPGPALWPKGRWHFLKIWVIYKKVQLRFLLLRTTGFDVEPFILWPNQWMKRYKMNLESMVRDAEKYNIHFIIVSQAIDYPLDFIEIQSKDSNQQRKIVNKISMRDDNWLYYLRQLDALKIQSEVAFNHKNTELFSIYEDLYRAKKSGINLFYDVVHLTPEGNRVIADALTHQIAKQLEFIKRER